MIDYIHSYLIVGVVWLLLQEFIYVSQNDFPHHKMNNGLRVRLLLLWPITMTAWIIGFIEAMRNHYNDEEGDF